MTRPSTARAPVVYQIDFTAVASGKRIASTKRRVRWRFGFANPKALADGQTGTACRGEEHDITLVWSITSGKRMVLADGKEVHYSHSRNGIFDYSWTMRGNHVCKIVAHAAPPMAPTPGFRQYDFFVNGQSFFSFPKVFRLGLKAGDPRATASSTSPSHIAERSSRGTERSAVDIAAIEAPHNQDEEEMYLQEAIRQSLQAEKAAADTAKREAQPSPAASIDYQDLLDFGTSDAPPALPPPASSDPYGVAAPYGAPPGAATYGAPPAQIANDPWNAQPSYDQKPPAAPAQIAADPWNPQPSQPAQPYSQAPATNGYGQNYGAPAQTATNGYGQNYGAPSSNSYDPWTNPGPSAAPQTAQQPNAIVPVQSQSSPWAAPVPAQNQSPNTPYQAPPSSAPNQTQPPQWGAPNPAPAQNQQAAWGGGQTEGLKRPPPGPDQSSSWNGAHNLKPPPGPDQTNSWGGAHDLKPPPPGPDHTNSWGGAHNSGQQAAAAAAQNPATSWNAPAPLQTNFNDNAYGAVPSTVTPMAQPTPSSIGFGSPPADFSGFSSGPTIPEHESASYNGDTGHAAEQHASSHDPAQEALAKLMNMDTFAVSSKNDNSRSNPFESTMSNTVGGSMSLADIQAHKDKHAPAKPIMNAPAPGPMVVSNQQSNYGSQYGVPQMGQQQAGFGVQQPSGFGGQQSSFGGQQSSFGGQQSSFGGQQSSFGGQQSSFGGQQSSFGRQQQQSSFGGGQPQQQSSFGGVQPQQQSSSFGGGQPQQQPSSFVGQPQGQPQGFQQYGQPPQQPMYGQQNPQPFAQAPQYGQTAQQTYY